MYVPAGLTVAAMGPGGSCLIGMTIATRLGVTRLLIRPTSTSANMCWTKLICTVLYWARRGLLAADCSHRIPRLLGALLDLGQGHTELIAQLCDVRVLVGRWRGLQGQQNDHR